MDNPFCWKLNSWITRRSGSGRVANFQNSHMFIRKSAFRKIIAYKIIYNCSIGYQIGIDFFCELNLLSIYFEVFTSYLLKSSQFIGKTFKRLNRLLLNIAKNTTYFATFIQKKQPYKPWFENQWTIYLFIKLIFLNTNHKCDLTLRVGISV